MKKVITGHDRSGKSVFAKVDAQAVTVTSPILDWHEIWATHADDTIPIELSAARSRESYSDLHKVFPTKNQSMFRVLDFKPADIAEVLSSNTRESVFDQLPGVAQHLEMDDPRVHTTDSVDYGVIISGRITVKLDRAVGAISPDLLVPCSGSFLECRIDVS